MPLRKLRRATGQSIGARQSLNGAAGVALNQILRAAGAKRQVKEELRADARQAVC
jgi:hypothetical protein